MARRRVVQRKKKTLSPEEKKRQLIIREYNKIARPVRAQLDIVAQNSPEEAIILLGKRGGFPSKYYGISQELYINPTYLSDTPTCALDEMVKEELHKTEDLIHTYDIVSIKNTVFDETIEGVTIFYYSHQFSDDHIDLDNYWAEARTIAGAPFLPRTTMRLSFHHDPLKCIFWALAINPKHHRKGIGRKLVAVAENIAVRMNADTIYMKPPILSQEFWKRMGYTFAHKMDYDGHKKIKS